ncbi:MAG: S9 family peptidase [Acidobacteriota bacterium]
MTDRRMSNLWIVNVDGTDHRPLTTGNFNDTSPRWSPDGKQLAYISSRDGSAQVYRRWMDTGETAKLTNLTQAPSGLNWSPDGKWLSFAMLVPEAPASIIKMPAAPEGAKWAEPAKVIDKLVYRYNGVGYLKPGYNHLFVLPAEGGTPRQVSSGRFHHGGGQVWGASEAVWTPDGKSLLISINRNDNFEIEARDTDVIEYSVADGAVKKLTTRKGPDGNPQVSPDGKLIAYLGFEDKFQGYQVTRLHVMNRDGSNQRIISGNWDRDVRGIAWAADSSGVYFLSDSEGNTGFHFMTLDGAVKKLFGNVASGTGASGGGAFTIAKNGAFAITIGNTNAPGEIAVGMLDEQKELGKGGEQFTLRPVIKPGTLHETKEAALASLGGKVPANNEILRNSERREGGNFVRGWYVVEKTPVITASDVQHASAIPARFGSGYSISFKLNSRGAEKLREWTKMNIGNLLSIVLNGEIESAPMIRSEIPNGDGVIEGNFTKQEAEGLSSSLNRSGAPLTTVTSVNEDLFASKKVGQVEEIWYNSSKDNRKIQGWIIKPPGFDASKKYPLIIEIHGGPFANYGSRFDLEKQLMAASGYVVLYTNPRGSTSYGQEFGNSIHHAYPGDDFFDLNSGVDAVVAKGYVDTDQLYVTGGSGGGVLTCWMIGRTTRFRAAVTVYPVINWYSFVLTSDIGNWTVNHWFPGFPWDNVEHYEKRNLLSVVKNVKTPTMVLTGEADYRTPMSDSEQYYQALKLLGVESVLVRVPDEPHGISVRPSHHISKLLHIIGWFDQHRKKTEPVQSASVK